MKLSDYPNAIVIDIETTGIDRDTEDILQLSIISIKGDVLFNDYFSPLFRMTWEEAQAMHGITPSMVRGKGLFVSRLPEIQAIFDKADLVIGYNSISFDMPFLASKGVSFIKKPSFDVMKTVSAITGKRYFKLTTLADKYGYTFKAHDSLEDCRATLMCAQKILDEGVLFPTRAKVRLTRTNKERELIVSLIDKGAKCAIYDVHKSKIPTNRGLLIRESTPKGKYAGKPRYRCEYKGNIVGWSYPSEIAEIEAIYSEAETIDCQIIFRIMDNGGWSVADIHDPNNIDKITLQKIQPTPVSLLTNRRISSKPEPNVNPTIALVLCICLGWLGAHRFYARQIGMGILYLLTAGLFLVGWIMDIFRLAKKVINKRE